MRVEQNMAVHYNINLQASSVIMMASMFLFSLPVTCSAAEVSLPIDEQILASATSPRTFDMFQIKSDGEVSVKLDLDMMFTLDQFRDLNRPANKSSGKAIATMTPWFLWPSNVIYFEIGENFSKLLKIVFKAMNMYKKYTCLDFQETDRSESRILLVSEADGCWSSVGNQNTVQKLNLASGCSNIITALHEIGHAIGLYDEHTRFDRDSYIKFTNGQAYLRYNIILSRSEAYTFGIRYDYKSVMHYGKNIGIKTLDRDYQDIIGTIQHLSFTDIKVINLLYQCAFTAGNCSLVKCPFNGFVLFTSFKGAPECQCWCDSGDNYDPLVLCASITKEVPGYNIRKSSSNSEINQTVCTDMRTDCATLKLKGGCSRNLRTMYTQCTKTCNFCGKGNNLCMDYEDGCHVLAGSGACKDEGLKKIMSRVCRKSCGLCQSPATPCDIQDTLL